MATKSNLTVREAHQWASIFLDQHQHRQANSQTYLMWLMDWNLTQWVSQQDRVLTDQEWTQIQSAFQRIVNHEPIQYIVGYQDFMDMRFKVTPDTLIPREETGGLIEALWTFQDHLPDQPKILDIGTGTGIIPIIIKKYWSAAQLTAVDISPAALKVAQENADIHQVAIDFRESDLFAALAGEVYDVIISNPPYIGQNELAVMDESVKRYEPSLALYADQQGLAIYQQIAQQVGDYLLPGGILLLEIGYRQGQAVQSLLKEAFPQAQIDIGQDFNGLDRYIFMHRKD